MRTGIALGSNRGDRLAHLRQARDGVAALDAVSGPLLQSPIYETDPVDSPPGASQFLNAVLEVGFEGEPLSLLESLQAIERRLGRPARSPRNAPRTIDLDILYMGDLALSLEGITIPHPRIRDRRFVLAPLFDLHPGLRLPGSGSTVAALLEALPPRPGAHCWKEEW